MNSDVEVTPGWLDVQIDYMEAHPQVAACQPKILSWHQKEFFEYAGARSLLIVMAILFAVAVYLKR